MRVVLSVDMEGVSQLSDPREIFAFRPEYWATGKPRIEADTAAAARGLLSGGAREVIVLDNHGGGNPQNVSPESLPEGARLETWNAFELPAQAWMRCSRSAITPAAAPTASSPTRTCRGCDCG
jgi:D-aminopeptidase